MRGRWNTEKNKPETWPGGCQVTAHGKLKEGETFFGALWREMIEELGERFARTVSTESLVEVSRHGEGDDTVVTYATLIDYSLVAAIEPGEDSGGIRELRHEEVTAIQVLRGSDETAGVPTEVTAMFGDERKAVEKAFALFSA